MGLLSLAAVLTWAIAALFVLAFLVVLFVASATAIPWYGWLFFAIATLLALLAFLLYGWDRYNRWAASQGPVELTSGDTGDSGSSTVAQL